MRQLIADCRYADTDVNAGTSDLNAADNLVIAEYQVKTSPDAKNLRVQVPAFAMTWGNGNRSGVFTAITCAIVGGVTQTATPVLGGPALFFDFAILPITAYTIRISIASASLNNFGSRPTGIHIAELPLTPGDFP